MKRFILFSIALTWLTAIQLFGQCSGGNQYLTTSAPTSNITSTISTCTFSGDYNVINSVVAGNTYTITAVQNSNGTLRCITVHTGSSNGPVVASGSGTVTFVAPSSGTYYVNINQNCGGCGTASNCITVEITCNSCAANPCATATNILGCGAGYTTSTTGASSYVSTLCATATPGLESVYSYTATQTGAYTLNISSVTGGGYAIGYNTSCGATGWTCVGTATTPSSSFGTINMVSGTTYYFLFDATSTAASSISFGLNCPPGGPTTAGDCVVGANVCSNAAFSVDPNGYGAINEICIAGTCTANPDINPASANSGCLLSEELNSTWMIVNILTGGTLTFQLGTPNSSNWYCLDWSMWPYNATACAGIQAGTLSPVRCNYNGSCEEFTGLASALPTGATSMTNWEPPLAVGSATQYVICLSNYSSAVTTIPLSFGGTAVVSCSPLGTETIYATGEAMTGFNTLKWTSSAELNVSNYSIERSLDGIHFETIGSIDATGLSMTEVSYQYEDVQPINGQAYYRIIMNHTNNTSNTSNPVVLTQKFMHDAEIIRTYPNPAHDKLNLVLCAETNAEYHVEMLALNGNEVFSSNYTVSKGLNAHTIDLSKYTSGFYLMKVYCQEKLIATHKIVID